MADHDTDAGEHPHAALPPLERGDDDWSAPIPQASKRSKMIAGGLAATIVATSSFAIGAKIGRDRAPAAQSPFGAAGRGGIAAAFPGGLPAGFPAGLASGGQTGAGTTSAAPTDNARTETSVAPGSDAATTTTPATGLGGLLPGLDLAPPAPGNAPGAQGGEAPDVMLGTVTAVDGRSVTVTRPDGTTFVIEVPQSDTPADLPAVGATLRFSAAPSG
jgi:hypothetical protein